MADSGRLVLGKNDIHTAAQLFVRERLTVARELRGLTKQQLADKVGKTPSAITQFEGGQARPDGRTLGMLALALRVSVAFFALPLVGGALSVDDSNFRSLRSARQRERRKALAHGSVIRDFADVLDEMFDLPVETVSKFSAIDYRSLDIEERALAVRAEWGLKLGPILDLVRLLETQGILVSIIPDDSTAVDAFSAWYKGRPMVFLLANKAWTHTRFDAAHELGHLVLHSDSNPGSADLELEANRFASAFLLPRDTFMRECPRKLDWEHFRELKKRWHVSLAALIRRARDLGCISEAGYRRGCIEINKRGWRTSEPDEPAPEKLTIIPEAVRCLRDEAVSLDELAAKIGVHANEFNELLGMNKNFATDQLGFHESPERLL